MGEEGANGHLPEMERLVGGLSEAVRGRGSCYGLCGPAGVGKAYLMRRLERTAKGLDFLVLRGRAEAGEGPEGLFSALLPPGIKPIQDHQLPSLLIDRFAEISSKGPTLFVLEDLHLADQSSISMLILMARSIADLPTMLLFSYDSEMMGTSYGDIHPLLDGVRILAREGNYEEVRLQNMDRVLLVRVVENELGGPMDVPLADLIWERSDGNPMVAIEAARLLVQARCLEKRDGRWTAVGKVHTELPDDYHAMIRSRLAMLVPEDREMLTVAALTGRSFDPRVVTAVLRKDFLETLERLDMVARDRGFLEEDGERYRFTTGAVRSVLIEDLPPSVQMDVHNRIAKTVESRMMKDSPFDDLSEHYYLAEKMEKCVCFSLLAGQRALSSGDHRSALDHFQKVLDATNGDGFEEERLFSLEGMADAEMMTDRALSACSRYDEVLRRSKHPAVLERVRAKRSRALSGLK